MIPLNTVCDFCGEEVDLDDESTYREVTSWVTGPKLDHPVLREQTGNVAHKFCIQLIIAGQAVDQPLLPLEDGDYQTDYLDKERE